MEILVHMRTAHTASIVTLVNTLHEAGALEIKDYEANLRSVANKMNASGGPEVALMIDDLADLLRIKEPTMQ
jgi:hypothetical protein